MMKKFLKKLRIILILKTKNLCEYDPWSWELWLLQTDYYLAEIPFLRSFYCIVPEELYGHKYTYCCLWMMQ